MNKKDVIATRVFDAPIELVWKAWTDPKLIMQWWGPDNFTCPFAEIDFQEGGKSLVCMRAPKEFGGQDMYSIWNYTKIVPMELIDLVTNLSDKDGNAIDPAVAGMPPEFTKDMRMTIAFKSVSKEKTEMTVTQYSWIVSKMSEMAETGLNQSLDKMRSIFFKV